MTDEDQKDFIKIINEVNARRQAGQLQTQEASEAEEEQAAVSEPAAGAIPTAQVLSVQTNEVATKNAQIQIWKETTQVWKERLLSPGSPLNPGERNSR